MTPDQFGLQRFEQGLFTSTQEQKQVIEQLCAQGIDPKGKESEGHLLAEFYLKRPANEVAHLAPRTNIRHCAPQTDSAIKTAAIA